MRIREPSYVCALVHSLLLLTFAGPVSAQSYPARPVRIVVPFAAGGGTDIQARILSKSLHERFGQPFIVDNRPGASGLIGAELVVNAPADGYNLLFTTATLATAPTFYASTMKFHPLKDLQPVIQVSTTPMVLIVQPGLPVRSPQDLVTLAKSAKKVLNAAINVPGSTSHLSAEMLKQFTGIQLTNVPYKGGGLSMTALMGGEVDFQFAEGLLAAPQVKAGKVRALAVTTAQPVEFFPGVPTMTSIWAGFVSDNWFAMYFPRGTPQDVVTTVNTAIGKALATEEVRGLFARDALVPIGGTSGELGTHLKSEIARYAEIIRKGKIALE